MKNIPMLASLSEGWQRELQEELMQPYVKTLFDFIADARAQASVIYPSDENIFRALQSTPLEKVKVVILGQDPYHGEGQAHGLSFSVQDGVKLPPSLVNIYKELQADLGIDNAKKGCLQSWAEQGVLLLNSVLTVEENRAGSHQGKGWETFTDKVIDVINHSSSHVVFLLWGSYAHKKGSKIDEGKHLVLRSVHPSPLSAYRGFFGCRHFSKANTYLEQQGKSAITWQV